MSLGKREKELVAVGISVAAGCKPCTDYHLKAVRETGATYDEIRDAIQLGAAVRKRAADVMEDYALKRNTKDDARGMPSARLDLLISIGAAYAVNSTDELERYRTAARKANVAEIDVKSVVKLAQFIRGKAILHVEDLVDLGPPEDQEPEPVPPRKAMSQGACGCHDSAITQAKEG